MAISKEKKKEMQVRKFARLRYENDLDRIITETINDVQRSLLRFQNKAFNMAVKHLKTISEMKEDMKGGN